MTLEVYLVISSYCCLIANHFLHSLHDAPWFKPSQSKEEVVSMLILCLAASEGDEAGDISAFHWREAHVLDQPKQREPLHQYSLDTSGVGGGDCKYRHLLVACVLFL